jgi:hypothetical protein
MPRAAFARLKRFYPSVPQRLNRVTDARIKRRIVILGWLDLSERMRHDKNLQIR